MWHVEGENRNAERSFVEKPEGNRLLASPKHRWEDNINIGPK
jgi:hypothetical protein